jgi:nucleotide-binding universal stress UspA family protein
MTDFRRILVPHDFSNHATAALQTAARLAAPGGRLIVLHVVVPIVPVTEISPAGIAPYVPTVELAKAAEQQLERVVAKALPARFRARVDRKVEVGDPFQCIMDAARRVDVIVMSTAGRTGLSHLLIGSVTEKVVRHSPVPVLTLRPEAARKAAKSRKR